MSEHHIVSPKYYAMNFVALTVLMIATVLVSFVHLGVFNLPVALAIAITKAMLIILIFMDVRNASQLTWVFAGAGFFWFMILLGITMVDMAPGVHESMGTAYTHAIPGSP